MDGHRPPAPHRWPRKNTWDQVRRRQEILRQLPGWDPADEFLFALPAADERWLAVQECTTGVVQIPVSVVGPLRLLAGDYELDERGGLQERSRRPDEVFVPLAHTEGGLAASVQRGIIACAERGIATYVIQDRITRASCFVLEDTAQALCLARWLEEQLPAMQAWLLDPDLPPQPEKPGGRVRPVSRHARLRELRTHVLGNMCHVLYRFTTGDACGPNMMTRNAYALNRWFVLERFPKATGIRPRRCVLEGNMGGDKKPSYQYFAEGHGKTVLAEAVLSEATCRRILHVSAEDLISLERIGVHGSHASGMQSSAFTPASAIAAVFAATGQDLGMVGTSSMAHGTVERAPGGVRFSLRLPGLEVGTVGGGTVLPHAQAYLRLMGCLGAGKVYRFAQVVAAVTLALEIPATASMAVAASENFYQAHLERGGLRVREAQKEEAQ